jgi:CxxC motif-containing protein (DUF1111 family)
MINLALQKPSLARFSAILLSTLLALLAGCDNATNSIEGAPPYSDFKVPEFDISETKPGGDTTVSTKPFASLELPAANISKELKPDFHAGKALANQPWVKAPTVTFARDGLGPVYNARTCLMCHIKGGKGFMPDTSDIPLMGTLVRLSKPGNLAEANKQAGVNPHPVYGDQIQGQSISLAHQLRHSQKPGTLKHSVAPEAYVHVNWIEQTFTYPDTHQVQLRKPNVEFRNLGYGELGDDTLIGLRVAPSIAGMGLLELIPQADINALSDEQDQNQDGISGRVNWVWDNKLKGMAAGRFGLKSNKATLDMTVAGAFANDVGITNSLAPNQPCTVKQTTCLAQEDGNDDEGVELPDHLLELVINFNRNLAPVSRRKPNNALVQEGREIFYQTGCQQCHNPRFVTGESESRPHLAKQTIWPYSDLLLHDMGSDLADNRPDFEASGSEWRTAPLWGVGILTEVNGNGALLHDGRARSVEEAILWHGGEALETKNRFVHLPKKKRQSLLQFVNSL